MEMFHTIDVMLSLRMGLGWGTGICSSVFHKFKSSLVWEFELYWEFGFLEEFRKNFQLLGSAITAQGLIANWSLGGEKTVLYIVCFAYSLLPLVVVVLCCHIKLLLSQPTRCTFVHFSS